MRRALLGLALVGVVSSARAETHVYEIPAEGTMHTYVCAVPGVGANGRDAAATLRRVSSVPLKGGWTHSAYSLSPDGQANLIQLPVGVELHFAGRRRTLKLALDAWRLFRWNPDSRRVAFWSPQEAHGESRRIALLDVRGAGAERPWRTLYTPPGGHLPFGFAWSPNGKALYVVERFEAGETLQCAIVRVLLNGERREVVRLPGLIDFLRLPSSWFADGRGATDRPYTILYGTPTGLYRLDPNDPQQSAVRLPFASANLVAAEWHPAKNVVALAYGEGSRSPGLRVVDLAQAPLARSAPLDPAADIHSLWWSPRGTYLGWATPRGVHVRRYEPENAKTFSITPPAGKTVRGFAWHGQERHLAYTADRHLRVFDLATGTDAEVAAFGAPAGFAAQPRWIGDQVFLTVHEDAAPEFTRFNAAFGSVRPYDPALERERRRPLPFALLELEDGRTLPIPSGVWRRYKDRLLGLKPGARLEISLRGGALARVAVPRGSSLHADPLLGTFAGQEEEGGRVWLRLTSGRRELVAPALLQDRKQALVLNTLEAGDPITYRLRGGMLVELTRGHSVPVIKPEVRALAHALEPGERVELHLEGSPRAQRFLVKARPQGDRVLLSPLVSGNPVGELTLKLAQISKLKRLGPEEKAVILDAWGALQPGDTIRLGLLTGVVEGVDEGGLVFRSWDARTRSWKSSERLSPDALRSTALQRGVPLRSEDEASFEEGHVLSASIERTRSGGPIAFQIELRHDAPHVVLAGVRLDVACVEGLGDGIASSVQILRVPPVFPGQGVTVHHLAEQRDALHGWVNVKLTETNVVPLASEKGRELVLTALGKARSSRTRRALYLVAGRCADTDLLRWLVREAVVRGDELADHDAAVEGLSQAGPAAYRCALAEATRDTPLPLGLTPSPVTGVFQLTPKPLPPGITPRAWRRGALRILAELDAPPPDELPQGLLSLYPARAGELQGEIEAFFSQHPEAGARLLLAAARQPQGKATPVAIVLDLLERVGEPVLREVQQALAGLGIRGVGDLRSGLQLAAARHEELARARLEQGRAQVSARLERGEVEGTLALARELRRELPLDEQVSALLGRACVQAAGQPGEGAEGEAQAVDLYEEALRLLPIGERALAATPLARITLGRAAADLEAGVDDHQVAALLDRAGGLAPALQGEASHLRGTLAAREAQRLYEAGDYDSALVQFEIASRYAPTDARLALRWRCWVRANSVALGALLLLGLLGLTALALTIRNRPRKVSIPANFEHYGRDRERKERGDA